MAKDPVEQRADITRAVGECILAWASVERGLTILYCQMIDFPSGGLSGSKGHPNLFWRHAGIFDAVISMDARLDMIGAALDFLKWHLPLVREPKHAAHWLPHLDGWKSLRNRVRKKYDKRNEVAHSDVVQRNLPGGGKEVRLQCFPTLTANTLRATKTILSLKELGERANSFKDLVAEIASFTGQAALVLKQFPESP